jgi:hypothetical protein
MGCERVEIGDLVLRVPGIDRARAEDLAREVADRLARALPLAGARATSGPLDLRVRIPAGTRPDDLGRVIAAEILRTLA